MKPENNRDYFLVHRKILTSPIFDNPDNLKVWIWCLAKASHKERDKMHGQQLVHLKAGEFIYGRIKAAGYLGMSESKVYRIMSFLEKCGNLNIKPNNKFSIVSVVKWGDYQFTEDDLEHQNEQQTNIKRTSNEHQANTNNKGNKGNKGNKDIPYGPDEIERTITVEVINKLEDRYPDLDVRGVLFDFKIYVDGNPYRYKNIPSALNNFCKKAEEEKRHRKSKKPKPTKYDPLGLGNVG